MPATPISQSDLRTFARQEDVELRFDRNRNPGDQLQTREGSFGGRLLRWFGKPTTEEKQQQNIAGKVEVWRTLNEMYGEEIGTQVFRANIGKLQGDTHLSSNQHPITGRHIRKMIEQGDRALLKAYGGAKLGDKSLTDFKDRRPPPGVPERATEDWMLRRSIGLPPPTDENPPNLDPNRRFDLRGIELRAEPVVLPDEGLKGERIATPLLEDIGQRLLESPHTDSFAWTLDLVRDNGRHPPSMHTIGVRIDRDDPDTVKVFDVRHGEVKVPKDQLSTWLEAHIGKNYRVDDLRLYRAEETMDDPRFQKEDGVWRQRHEYSPDPEKFSQELTKLSKDEMKPESVGEQEREIQVCTLFNKDSKRSSFLVETGGRSHLMTTENAPEVMKALTGGGTSEEERTAIYNLSVLLNQNLGNSMMGHILTPFETIPFLPGGAVRAQTNVSRTGDIIRIEVDLVQAMRRLGDEGRVPTGRDDLDPHSTITGSVAIEISLTDLREPGGYSKFQLVKPPRFEVDLKPQLGPHGDDDAEIAAHRQVNVLLLEKGGRLVSNPLGGYEDPSRALHELIGEPVARTFDDLPGLEPNGVTNLSRLLSPTTGTRLHETLMRSVLDDEAFTLQPGDESRLSTTVTPLILEDGRQVVDIEYRGAIPRELLENAPLTVVHDLSGGPGGEVDLDTVVRLRIPVEQLNRENLPERFDFLHPWRLESRA